MCSRVAALAAYLVGVNELVVLASGAALAAANHLLRHPPRGWLNEIFAAPLAISGGPLFADPTGGQLWQLFATVLKIGAVLYGSGYVLLAFLRGDFVDRLGWITEQRLVDAVPIGQVTPGPVFTTATFVGYLVAGLVGAFLATVAIFTQSFTFVGLLTRLTDRLRASPWTSATLDGVNATAFGADGRGLLPAGRQRDHRPAHLGHRGDHPAVAMEDQTQQRLVHRRRCAHRTRDRRGMNGGRAAGTGRWVGTARRSPTDPLPTRHCGRDPLRSSQRRGVAGAAG